MRLGFLARDGAAFLCFLILALVETYPLALHLGTHLPYSLHDPGEVLTRLEWTMTGWVPLAVWAVIAFLRRPATWKAGAAVACLWLALATHIYSAFMAGFLALFVLVAGALWGGFPWRWLRQHAGRVAAAVVVATLPFLPVIDGFFEVPRKWSEVRSIWYARWYALEPADYLAPPAGSAWYAAALGPQFSRAGRAEQIHEASAAFPGVMPLLLGALGLGWALRRGLHGDRRLAAVATAAVVAVVAGFVLSLGPEFIWRDRPTGVMLPFAWLHSVFPPIRALRAVGRFSYLLVAGLAVLTAGAVLLLVVETLHAPLELFPIATLVPSSPVNRFLKTLPPAPMIFVPVEAPSEPWPESRRMYWAVTSGPFRIVNGSSAIYPASYWDLERLTDDATPSDLPALTGRVFLGQDTPPGWSYRFTDRIMTPADPGTYRLAISLLAEGIIWFDEMTPPGVQPQVYDVTVRPGQDSPPCALSPR